MAAIAPQAHLQRSRSGRREVIFPMFVTEQRQTVWVQFTPATVEAKARLREASQSEGPPIYQPTRTVRLIIAINRQLALKDFDFGSFLLLVLWRIALLPHGLTAHIDAMSVVNETVEDAVSDGGIADLLVPARDRQLGSEDGGTILVAIFADLPDFATLVFIQRRHRP